MKKLILGIIIFVISVFVGMNYAKSDKNYLIVYNTTNVEVNTSKLFDQFEREVTAVERSKRLAFIEKNYSVYELYFGNLLSKNIDNPKEILAYKENIKKLNTLTEKLKAKYSE